MNSAYSILVADDSAFVRKKLARDLAGTEFNIVAEARDGLEAVDQYRNCAPDMVLLDIIMPRCTGSQALQQIMRRFGIRAEVFREGH